MEYLPIQEYLKRPGLSSSNLHLFAEFPAKYKAFIDGRFMKKETDSLVFGGAYHTYILEPDRFDREYVVEPDSLSEGCKTDKGTISTRPKSTKEYEERLNAFMADHEGQILISSFEKRKLEWMKEALLQHSEAAYYLSVLHKGQIEQSIFWEQPIGAFSEETVLCKTRPDYFDDFVLDLKTADSADPKTFKYKKVLYGYSYHRQMTLQLMGLESEGIRPFQYLWIAQEKDPPFAVSVHEASEDLMQWSREQVEKLLERFYFCSKNNEWPAFTGVNTITVDGEYAFG